MHYYQFNIGDYATHTRHLSIYEDLAYRRLLDWYYLNEKPIPTDAQQAAKLILMRNRHPDVECVLKEFFQLTENGWINKRADAEISKFKEFSEAGKRGAAKRWSKGGDSPPIAPPIAPLIANNNQEPINNNHKPVTIKKPTAEYSDEFELAWAAYPPRNGASKKDSFKAWCARIKSGASANVMIEGATRYAIYCKVQGTEQQYIKQPSTFFGTGEHYLSDWTSTQPARRGMPAPENFDNKDYGDGITLL
jgi:uncharacterized protein YdaU (DUF1376 family)